MTQERDDNEGWSMYLEMSPPVFMAAMQAVQFLVDREGVCISTAYAGPDGCQIPVADGDWIQSTDTVSACFWARSRRSLERLNEVLRGIGISSLN